MLPSGANAMAGDDSSKGRKARSDPEVRKAALLLSGLVTTGDDGLEEFRDRRAGDKALSVDVLKRARDILDAVGAAIAGTSGPSLASLERAWAALGEGARKEKDATSEGDPPAGSSARSASPPVPAAVPAPVSVRGEADPPPSPSPPAVVPAPVPLAALAAPPLAAPPLAAPALPAPAPVPALAGPPSQSPPLAAPVVPA
ncbi:MAG: hypothetical protein HY908_12805, partial [Myxococcales bacterium]|nr:hypothetical protein [Myxococcales bacterium]